MVNTKFLSLKTLNALNEMKMKPVMRVAVRETLCSIPEDCRARFLNKEIGFHNAFSMATYLNRQLGYKAFVVKTNDGKRSYTVYHFSRETLERCTKECEDIVRI